MGKATIIGIDLAKRSFQVHGAKADGSVAYRRKLSRGKLLGFLASQPGCTVAMEACASAHYWGREIAALGHEVRLVPPIYVKPFVKRQKNDTADAEAIAEAAQRPTMHFVAVKAEAQQAQGMLFRTRDLLVRQRTQTINALRGHLAEYGVVAPQGRARIGQLAGVLEDGDSGLPETVVELGWLLLARIGELDEKIDGLDDPRNRTDHRDGHPSLRPTDGELPAGARLLGLARLGAAATHDGGQTQTWRDIKDGSARPQATLDHGSHGGCPPRESTRRGIGPMAGQDVGTQAQDAGGGGVGQQDGTGRLGADHEEGDLPGSRRRLTGQRKERSCREMMWAGRTNG